MLKKVIYAIIVALTVILVGITVVFVMEEKDMIELTFMLEHDNSNEFKDIVINNDTDNGQKETKKKSKKTQKKKRDFEKFVFVGDSRFVGISKYSTSEQDVFISEIGEGHSFLIQQMSNIKYHCNENTALIIGLGVNDAHANADKYIETINEMNETMDCQIYFVSINPVEEEKARANGYNVKTQIIDDFNQTAIEELDEDIIYIDTNEYLKEVGFTTQDGLHFTEDISQELYMYIKDFVNTY